MGKTFKRFSSKWDDDDFEAQETINRKAKKKFKKLREERRHKDELMDMIERQSSDDGFE